MPTTKRRLRLGDGMVPHMDAVLRPLQDKKEMLYVLPGSHAQEYAQRRFPHKAVKEVTGGWQPPAKRPATS